MKRISKTDLLCLFDAVKGVCFASMTVRTEPIIVGGKKNKFKGCTFKRKKINVMLSNCKKNVYKRHLLKKLNIDLKFEGNYKLSKRKWGVHSEAISSIIEHGDKNYVEVIILRESSPQFIFADRIVDKGYVVGLRERNEKEVVKLRTYDINHIESIRIFGEEFQVI